jgi:PAS domain S-box-containing protein
MLCRQADAPKAHTVFEPHELYRRLVELSPYGILICLENRVVFLNPAAVRLFNAESPEQLVGTSIFDLFDPGARDGFTSWFDRVSAGDAVPPIEDKLRTPDGHVCDVEVTGAIIEYGATQAIQLIVHDISPRKRAEAALRESEERLRLAFVAAEEGVWDWNLETGAVVYSPRWKQMLGYGEDEIDPDIREWERLLHPDDFARARQLGDAVNRGELAYEGEFRLRHKNGHYVHVLSRGFPIRHETSGPVVRIVGTHFDLTERKRSEAERARTELLARLVFAQEDERRRIAREMHDQFGEQLTALSRGIDNLKRTVADRPDLSMQLRAIEQVAQQLDRDVENLVWELRPTALDDLGLRAALANYIQTWSERENIHAGLHTSGLLDERLPADTETTLYRIAQEALTNVARHAQATNVDVILERNDESVMLIVEDNGIGFEAEDGGTRPGGFGLMGMRERAALVGATLQIESTPGKGTTILLRLKTPSLPESDRA